MDDVLAELLAAENARDWAAVQALLHPEGEWTLIGPDTTTVVRGRTANMNRILAAHESAYAAIARITRGNLRLLERFIPQIQRLMKTNELETITNDVCSSLIS